MKKILAILFAGFFLVFFFVSTMVNQVADTASDPKVIAGMLDDADTYDYIYENIIGNIVQDIVDNGIEIESGIHGNSMIAKLEFEDTEATALAVTNLIETLVPREYTKRKIEEGLEGILPYLAGETDQFAVDFEIQDRVREVPLAFQQLITDLDLTEQIIDDLLVPALDRFLGQLSDQALGIDFTDEELQQVANEIFESQWLETQIIGAINEITPFFTGDADSFNVVVTLDDRALVIGQILKDKLMNEETLYSLVFNRVVDPLIQKTIADSTDIGFGVSLTEDEVVEAFEVIAPRPWVVEQGAGVIDTLTDYLIGDIDYLEYTVDLNQRKVAAAEELQTLAVTKLTSTISDIPVCKNPIHAMGAASDLAARELPRCMAGGDATVDQTLKLFAPKIQAQVLNFVENQVPNSISYMQADFESQVGDDFESVEQLRTRIIEGFSFSNQDLVDIIAGDGDSQAKDDAEEALGIVAAGFVITEADFTENLDSASLDQFNEVRDYVWLAFSLRWLIWILLLIPLVFIAFLGGRTWAGRLRWAGGVAVCAAVLVYCGILLSWSFIQANYDYVPDLYPSISEKFREDYPLLSAELAGDEIALRLEKAAGSWQYGWRNQVLPLAYAGLGVFLLGTLLNIFNRRKLQKLANDHPLAGKTDINTSHSQLPDQSVSASDMKDGISDTQRSVSDNDTPHGFNEKSK